MTLAFEKFMLEYGMTGAEKADGYSPSAFLELDEREKKIVFSLLVKELPWSAEWLFPLDPDAALIIAKEKEKELRGNGYAHVYKLQQFIVKYSGDLVYQAHMIEDYPNYDEDLKPRVVDAIHCTPKNSATAEFFKRVILTEVTTDAVARASRHFLDDLSFPNATGEEKNIYRRLMNELRSDGLKDKLGAIRYVEKWRAGNN